MTRSLWIILAAGGSAALILGALGFQHLGGLHPCAMCIWQRYPHVLAILIGLLALLRPGWPLPALGAAAALTTSAIGLYHAGVEQKWWDGPASCTSGSITGLSADELFDQIMAAPVTSCGDIVWQMWGLSMAGWNAVFSLLLAFFWLKACRR